MQLLATADLHYNHARSRPLAEDLITRMNRAGGDILLVIGDTAASSGDALERCLERFHFKGPKLFVAGNHELWTSGGDSYEIYTQHLPRRLHDLGWQWLEETPFVHGTLAIVGSIGWYDYSFAQTSLGIPRRFYEHKISPGAASHFEQYAPLLESADDIPPSAMEVIARWNDGRYVKLHRSDEEFLEQLLTRLRAQLNQLAGMQHIVAAVHHLPFRQLLPPPHNAQWDFAKAYLGSDRIGQVLQEYPNVRDVLCGHSHMPTEMHLGDIRVINIGSGYRWKTFRQIDLALTGMV